MPEDSYQETDRLTEEAFSARERLWQSVGEIEAGTYGFLINPALTGGPEWPNMTQSYRKIKLTNGNTVLATDGLSNPFHPAHSHRRDGGSGFGLEFYIETDENLGSANHSWQLNVLNQVAQTAAHHGGVKQLLDEIKYISLDLRNQDLPGGYQHEVEGQIETIAGALLGLPSKIIPSQLLLPNGNISLVSVTTLYPAELDIVAQGEDARKKLAEQFTSKYEEPLSSAIREPIVENT